MTLRINDISDLDENFCKYIIDISRLMFKKRFSKKKVSAINKYFSETFPHPQLNGDTYNATDILIEAMNHLKYRNEKDECFIIYVDDEIRYKKYPIKLITLCKEINYGMLGARGYPIITDVFQQIQSNIKMYKNMYLLLHKKSEKGEDTE